MSKQTEFVCIRKCYHRTRVWKPGEVVSVTDITACESCEGTGKDKKGKICIKCKGTGRQDPPHHFRPVNESPAVREEQEQETVEAMKDQLRKQIKDMGGDYDNRWGVDKLRSTIVRLTKEKGAEV